MIVDKLPHTVNGLVAGVVWGVVAIIGGLSSHDIIAEIGVIGGAITIGLNMALAWYHKIERQRRIEYIAWRRARVCPIDEVSEEEEGKAHKPVKPSVSHHKESESPKPETLDKEST